MRQTFEIWIKDFNQNGNIIPTKTLVQTIPAETEGDLKLISPIVRNEMGSAESFEFSIEAGTKFYDAFLQMKTFIQIIYDDVTIFYGRVITIDNNSFRGTRRIRCEGPIAFLLDSPVEGTEEKNRKEISTYQYIQKLINNHNNYIHNETNKVFHIGLVPGSSGYSNLSAAQRIKSDTRKFGSDSWTDTKAALEDLRSHYGGYFRTRYENNEIYFDWIDQYFNGKDKNDQKIEVGKNILDISNVTELDNIFTAIVPIGRVNVTSSSENGKSSSKQENLYIDGKVLEVPAILDYYGATAHNHKGLDFGYHTYEDYRDAIVKYGRIIKTVTFPDAETKAKLMQEACEWIKLNYQGEVTKFTIKAIDMRQIRKNTSKIMVGDRVEIIYPVGNEKGEFVNRSTVQTCLSISFDLYHPENNSYTFGIPANILTKTYGVDKQGKSTTSPSSSPPRSGGGVGGPKEKSWLDELANWLMHHKMRFGSNEGAVKPYTEDQAGIMSGEYLYDPQIPAGTSWLVRAQRLTPETGGQERWAATRAQLGDYRFGEEVIAAWNVCEYVKYEYGIDLRGGIPGTDVEAPDVTNDGENLTFWQKVWNPVTEAFDKTKTAVLKLREAFTDHVLDFYGPDGEAIHSYMDSSGNWHYYYIDPFTGEKVETNARDLAVEDVKTEKRIGWVVTEDGEGNYDVNPNGFPGAMTLAIENYAHGELVTARVAGELMYLGNYKTQEYTAVSLKHMDNICGEFDYVKDSEGIDHLRVDSGGGMRIWHAKKDPKTGEYELDEHGRIKYGEFGIYDDNTLTGGMITEHLADGSVHTKIKGDIVDIEASQVKAGTDFDSVEAWLIQNGVNLDNYKGLITPRVAACEGWIENLKTDKLDANNINTKLETVTNLIVRNIKGVNTTQSDSTATFGSYYGDHYYISYATGPGSSETIDLKQSVAHASITRNNNTYTLNLYTATNSKIEPREGDVMTFSRAVTSYTFTGPSNGNYSITPNPQGEPTLQFYLQAPIDYVPTLVTDNDKKVKARIEVMKPNDSGQPSLIGYSELYIDSSKSWTAGQEDGKRIGWDLARGFVVVPEESTAHEYFDFGIPAVDYNNDSSIRYTVTVTNNYAYIRNPLNNPVARTKNTAYDNGWTAAYNKCHNAPEGSGDYFDVKIPASNTGGDSSYRFTLSGSGGKAQVKNSLGKVVAEKSVGGGEAHTHSVTFSYSSKHLGNGVYEHTYTTVTNSSYSPTNNNTTLWF